MLKVSNKHNTKQSQRLYVLVQNCSEALIYSPDCTATAWLSAPVQQHVVRCLHGGVRFEPNWNSHNTVQHEPLPPRFSDIQFTIITFLTEIQNSYFR
jgi:hypothetical protein